MSTSLNPSAHPISKTLYSQLFRSTAHTTVATALLLPPHHLGSRCFLGPEESFLFRQHPRQVGIFLQILHDPLPVIINDVGDVEGWWVGGKGVVVEEARIGGQEVEEEGRERAMAWLLQRCNAPNGALLSGRVVRASMQVPDCPKRRGCHDYKLVKFSNRTLWLSLRCSCSLLLFLFAFLFWSSNSPLRSRNVPPSHTLHTT